MSQVLVGNRFAEYMSLAIIPIRGFAMENTIEKVDASLLLARISARERLTFEEWKLVEDSATTEELGRLADQLRLYYHPDNVVTYVVDRTCACRSARSARSIASPARPKATSTVMKRSSARSKK